MAIKMDPITYFPDEIGFKILSYLDAQELGQCCQVSKIWLRLASDNNLWSKIFPEITIPSGIGTKRYFDTHAIKSKDEVAQRIREFANKVQLNQIGSFTCILPFNPDSIIRAKLGCGNVSTCGEPNLKEVCIFKGTFHGGCAPCLSTFSSNFEIPGFWVNPTPPHRPSFYNITVMLPCREDRYEDHLFERIEQILKNREKKLCSRNNVGTLI